MRFIIKYCITVYCMLMALQSSAQYSNRINGSFENILFKQFVTKIEAQTNYHFYYDTLQLDSLKVNLVANNLSLQETLTQIFQRTSHVFSVDDEGHVFITTNVPIQTQIPAAFFELKAVDNAPKTIIEEPEKITALKSTVENKLYEVGSRGENKKSAIITGFVKDIKNGEALIGASVYIDSLSTGVVTDQFGYYSITVPTGRYTLQVSSLGMKETRRRIVVYSDGKLNIEMQDDVPSLKNITVEAGRKNNVRSLQMGVEKLSIKTIKQVPVVFGEADILRVVMALPGVTSVGEASSGFNVRGGAADQNLILLNDATIYNPSHLFGFFSAFNPDVVKGVELYKSAIPVKYGGRLSSVLDVSTKDGNDKKITGTGGIGLLTSKLTIEGPLQKEKTSFIIGGRTTYSNWLLKAVPNDAYKNSSASFYDLNIHITHTIDAKNNLYLTGYTSQDKFQLNKDTSYKYGNDNLILKWKHIFNNKFYGVASAGLDHYKYSVSSTFNPVNSFRLGFDINQKNYRVDLNYTPNNKHSVNFGFNAVYYKLHPGSFKPGSIQSLVKENILEAEKGVETALYIADQFTISPKLSVNVGLRYSMFNYLGPHKVFGYVDGLPKQSSTINDTINYSGGKVITTYHGPEYRASLRYSFSNTASVKFSFNTLRQYIHMLSNTTSISPTDIWKLSDTHIQPQSGNQLSLGFYKNLRSNSIETSFEIYYKEMKNFMDYRSGAELLLNHHIETDVISTKGRAYGAELMLKKLTGKFNGWISYTYSRTMLKTNDPIAGENINKGEYYPASFDKPHNLNVIANFKFSHRLNVSFNFVYNTGRPITLPIAAFTSGGAQRLLYSDRNQYRIPDYLRSDISINFDGNHKIKQLAHNSWSVGVYNMTARKNAYSVYFVQENGAVKGYQLSIFGTAIPFITYNFRF
jgi:hypothetical protein